jgi:hypothetical protein
MCFLNQQYSFVALVTMSYANIPRVAMNFNGMFEKHNNLNMFFYEKKNGSYSTTFSIIWEIYLPLIQ